jgi:hypothetical protein
MLLTPLEWIEIETLCWLDSINEIASHRRALEEPPAN